MPGDITIAQTARAMKSTVNYVYGLVWSGKLPAHRIGNRWFVSADAVAARIAKRQKNRSALDNSSQVQPSTREQESLEYSS